VVTRGGGSVEDLWTFNEEKVARAIHASPVPVVSAVGHEVDFTIADFVADLRMPTPSAAAERLAPVLSDLELHLQTTQTRLRKAAERRILEEHQRVGRLTARLSDPRRLLGQKRLHVSAQMERMMNALRSTFRLQSARHKALLERLSRQHPRARLQRNQEQLRKLSDRLSSAIRERLRQRQAALKRVSIALERRTPRSRIQSEHRRLSALSARLNQSHGTGLNDFRTLLHRLEGRLSTLNPLQVLARGYSVTFRRADGAVVRSAADVKPGDSVAIRLAPKGASTVDECEVIDATVTSSKS
jgi:exodeoxyribonuclease VII large subunit